MKSLSFELEYTKYSKSGTREIKIKKDLNIGDETTFAEVSEWLAALKSAVAEAVRVTKSGNTFIFQLSRGTYDNWHSDKPLLQKSFDCWNTYGTEQDEEGVYLSPDTRYTCETWDLYLTPKTVLEDIKNL